MRIRRIALFALICPMAACATGTPRVESTRVHPLDTFVVLDRPPIIEATGEEDVNLAVLQAQRLDPAALAAREGARRVGGEALPFLTRTEVGQAFLELAQPRAIARGSPPEACPALGIGGGKGTKDRGAAARAALGACLDALGAAAEGCGCRVVGIDNVLTVPRSETSYAVGVAARLYSPDLGQDALIVAEDIGAGETLLRDLAGPVALVRHLPERRVEIALVGEGPAIFEGRSIPIGFRRGRLAERIYARDESGRSLTLLIGFSPAELEAQAGAWLDEPAQG